MENEKSGMSIFYDLLKKIGIFNIIIMLLFPLVVGILLYKLKPTIVLDYPLVKTNNTQTPLVCYQSVCKDEDYKQVENVNESIRIGEAKISTIKVAGYTVVLTIIFYIALYVRSLF